MKGHMDKQADGTILAADLRTLAEADACRTPMDALLEAAGRGEWDDDRGFRLLGRLWTLKRAMYYVYGAWAMGLNVNEFPPAVAYLFGKQIYDDSTHEMQYVDEILRRGWAPTQRAAFAHPYCAFVPATRLAYFVFALRALTNNLDQPLAEHADVDRRAVRQGVVGAGRHVLAAHDQQRAREGPADRLNGR